ncbi:MAG TPA: tetratricopeptide repeat protein [Pyrinomonadaceae bacterium]|nr:tetratricopeptide repeat protein [Pyrinomonadaceae bacterium]
MNKRRIIAVLIAFVLTIAATAMWSASTIEREGDPDANVLEDSGSDAGNNVTEQKKGGNKIVKVLAAPFKAFGSLFKRNNDGKFQRMSEKDAEKFQSVGVERVDYDRNADKKRTITGSAKEHLQIGRQLLLSGQVNEAITELSMAASLDPKLTEAHNLLGVAYDQKGLVDRARESYEKAVKSDSDDAETLNNLGFSLYKAGNYRAAVDRLKRAAKLAPTDERILNNLGLALCRLGKFDDAYKSFARAGGPLTGNLNIAKMLERFGREDDAIKYYEDARKIDPNNSIALRRLADLYKRVGKLVEAEEVRVALAARSNGSGSVATMER